MCKHRFPLNNFKHMHQTRICCTEALPAHYCVDIMTVVTSTVDADSEEKQQELLSLITDKWSSDKELLQYVHLPHTLSRYLRARKGNVHEASALLDGTLQWRKEALLGTLSVSEFEDELKAGKMYVTGPDRDGHGVLITRKKADGFKPGPGAYEHYVRHLAFTLDTCVRAMSQGQHQWVWIMDMAGYSRANSPPLNISLETRRILADRYPERMKACFIIDAPSIFSWLWSALSPFIDPVTRAKIKFIKSSDLPAEGQEPAKAVRDPGVAAFLPYMQYYHAPYDEAAYRQLLSRVGWENSGVPGDQAKAIVD